MTQSIPTFLLVACWMASSGTHAETVLRVVPQNDVVLLDPVFGTATVSNIAGTMIYEPLFSWNSHLQPKPQMVESRSESPDRLTWRFTLRPGLRFHDGQQVTTAGVIPSMQRWMGFDGDRRRLADNLVAMVPVDTATFTMTLKQPFPSMLATLATAPSRFAAIMRAKDLADLKKQVKTEIGSGPFRYVAAEQVNGSRIVWERNPDYVPYRELPDGLASGHVVEVDPFWILLAKLGRVWPEGGPSLSGA